MAIFGIGIDVIETRRLLKCNTHSFANKILSPSELPAFNLAKNKELFLIKRFSLKEAVSKAFGVGIGKKLSFKHITILKNENGKPICMVDSAASENITGIKNTTIHISVSDTATLVQSYAIVEVLP